MLLDTLLGLLPELNKAFFETIYMVAISLFVAIIVGLPLGVLLFVTDRGLFLEHAILKSVLGFLVNMVRSIPFIILLVGLLPLTKLLTGTTIGPTAASVSLSVAAIPFSHESWKPRCARLKKTLLKQRWRLGRRRG